jgi:hypothetical protein
VVIILIIIDEYSINGYWLLFYKWLLAIILLMIIVLVAIGGYSINGY